MGGQLYRVAPLDKGVIHVLGRTKWGGMRFHHAAQNGMKLETEELFISGIFHLMFLDLSWQQVTELLETEASNKGQLV